MERVKIIALIALVLAWVALLVIRFLTYPEPERVPLKYTSGQQGSPRAAVVSAAMPSVVHWPPIRRAELPSPTPWNIFGPLPSSQKRGQARLKRASPLRAKGQAPQGQKTGTGTPSASQSPAPLVYIPPPPPPAPPPPSPEEVAAEQARGQRELAIQQARQQMTQYRFLGYLTENGEPQAFLGKGQDLFIVRNGEVLDGQIVVSGIDGGSITLVVPTLAVTNRLELPKN